MEPAPEPAAARNEGGETIAFEVALTPRDIAAGYFHAAARQYGVATIMPLAAIVAIIGLFLLVPLEFESAQATLAHRITVAVIAGVLLFVPTALYATARRAFAGMSDPRQRYEADSEGLHLIADAGRASLRWGAFAGRRIGARAFFLFVGATGVRILPRAGLDAATDAALLALLRRKVPEAPRGILARRGYLVVRIGLLAVVLGTLIWAAT